MAIFSSEMGEFIEILPPMKRVSDEWYQGTADAVYQNLQSILTEAPDAGAGPLGRPHLQNELPGHDGTGTSSQRADITIATIQVAPGEASRFGVAQIESRLPRQRL